MPYTENTLQELAFMYNTDKASHGYMDFYEKHLPKNPKKILEIGVHRGASMRMWRKYFPDAELHGLDLFAEFDPPSDIQGVTWHKGNQCDYLLLEKLRNEDFDLIIEDCSHNARDQMITFFGLFNGKHYFIEDLHCNYDPFYSQGLPQSLSAVETFILLNGKRPETKERVDVIYGENIILIKCS